MNIVLVYNPASGSALSPTELRKKCRRANIVIDQLIPISAGFEHKLAPFIKRGNIIAVIGGDGSLSSIASLLVGTDATLAPLPGGTLNHFTKDLGIAQDVDQALKRLKHASPRWIDVATVNDVVFINNSSLGLYPTSLVLRGELESRIGKWPAAIIADVKALFQFHRLYVTIDQKTFHTPFIFVGNNHYLLDEAGVMRTKLDEAVLSVLFAKTNSRLKLLQIVLWTVIGRAHQLDEIHEHLVTEVTIHTKKQLLHVSRDGEVETLRAPLRYEIKPASLKIL